MTTSQKVIIPFLGVVILCAFKSDLESYSGYLKYDGCKKSHLKGRIKSCAQTEYRAISSKIIKSVEFYDEAGYITMRIDTFFERPDDSVLHPEIIPDRHFRYETYTYTYNDKKQLIEKKFAGHLRGEIEKQDELYTYTYNDKDQLELAVATGNRRGTDNNSGIKHYYNTDGTLKISRSFPVSPISGDSATSKYEYNKRENSVMEYEYNFDRFDPYDKSVFDKNGNMVESIHYIGDMKTRRSMKYDADGWMLRMSEHDKSPDYIFTHENRDDHGNYLKTTVKISTSTFSVTLRQIEYYE